MKKILFNALALFLLVFIGKNAYAVIPTVVYAPPPAYTTGVTITPLSPTVGGGGVTGTYGAVSTFSTLGGKTEAITYDPISAAFYAVDYTNGYLDKITTAGGYSKINTPTINFNAGSSIVVDGNENIWVTDAVGGDVYEFSIIGTLEQTIAIASCAGISVDASNNVYVVTTTGKIYKIASGGTTATQILTTVALTTPYGIAISGNNIFISQDGIANNIIEIANGITGSTATTVFATGGNTPHNLTFDSGGNLFVANYGAGNVIKITPAGVASVVVTTGNPGQVAFDATGNLYIADFTTAVKKSVVQYFTYTGTLPAGLTFNYVTGVVSGTPTTAGSSSILVTGYNSTGMSTPAAVINFVVNKGTLIITATGPAKTYGMAITTGTSTINFTATGAAPGQTVTSVTLTPNAAGASATTAAGTAYTITPSAPTGTGGFLASNYNITYNTYNGIVAQAPLTVSGGVSKVFGTALTSGPGSTAFASTGLQNGETIGSVTGVYGTGSAATAAVGTYANQSTVSLATGGTFNAANYNITYTTGNIVVTPAPLTITAGNETKSYGSTFTFAGTEFGVTGLKNSDAVNTVTLTSAGSVSTAAAGSYTIVPSAAVGNASFVASNYTITYTNGTMTVSTLPITITATGPTKTYGTALPTGTSTTNFTVTGTYASGQSVTSVTLTPNAAGTSATTAAGAAYTVTPSAATGTGGFVTSNYAITYVAYSGTVSQANLTITATGPTKTYGTALTAGASTTNFTASGTITGQTVTSVTLSPNAAGASTTTPAGSAYTVTPSAPTGTGGFLASNYNITYNIYNGTVAQAPLIITADNQIKIQGAVNPTLTVTYTGFVNSETNAVLTTQPTISTTATTSSPIGPYPITVSGAAANNYSITYVNGTLTINVDPPMISYSNPSPYIVGTPVSPLTPSNSGGPVSTSGTYAPGVIILKTTNGLNGAYGMAVDTSGNAFVANQGANTITEYSTSGAISTFNVGAGTGPVGLVYDASGNAYVLDQTTKTIVKYPGGNLSGTGTTIVSGLSTPTGIAIDAAGNLYVANSGNNTITKYTPAGGAPTLTINAPTIFFGIIQAGYFSAGISVDAAGNIYVSDKNYDFGGSSVDVYSSNGTFITNYYMGSTQSGIFIDNTGQIYTTDTGANTATVSTPNFASTVITETGYNTPEGVVADGAGDFFVSDYANNTVTEYTPVKGYYLTGVLPAGLVFNSTTGVVTGRPQKPFALTSYTVTAYNISGKSSTTFRISCGANPPVIAYTPSTVMCVQNVSISNDSPVLTGGPIMAAGFTTPGTTQPGTLNNPWGMTKDASGNIYVVNYTGKTVIKYNTAGAVALTFTVAYNPSGVAVDASGNIYVIMENGYIYKYNSGGTGATLVTNTIYNYSANSNGYGIAIDASNSLYVTDEYDGIIWKYTTATGATKLVTKGTGGLLNPTGIVVDQYGLIYVNDLTANSLIEYNASGAYVTTLVSGLNNPYALYIDSQGDYFIGDIANHTVTEYNISGTLVGTITLSNTASPEGIVTDASGNVYVSDYTNNTVTKYAPFYYKITSGTLPSGLMFSQTTGTFSGAPTGTFPNTSITVTAYGSDGGNGTATVIFSCNVSYDWIGAVSTDWNNTANWESKIIPPTGKSPSIGVNYAFNYQPLVGTATAATTLDSLKFGNFGGKAPVLTINTGYQLTFNNIVKISDANSGTTPYVATIAGAGTINTTNLSVTATTAAANTYSEAISSSIALLKITGNVNLTSSFSTYAYNAGFNVTGGITSVAGSLNTLNAAASASTFTITNGTLQLANANPLGNLSSIGTNITSFQNPGATIEYSGGNQYVYTDAAVANLSNTFTYQNIKFSGTGVKTPTSGNLYIPGNFTNALTLNDASDYISLTSTPVYFNGTTAQSIYGGNGTGTTFKSITFNGTSTTTIQSGNANVSSTGTLTMSGSAQLVANGFLTLNSDANGNAAVAPITSGTPISGNVNVQRYITGERGYRLMSSPVYAGNTGGNKIFSVNYLVNSLYVTGTGPGFTATGNPTLYLYDEGFVPQYSTFFNSNFVAISSLSMGTGSTPAYPLNTNGAGIANTTIPVGNGFYNFFRGNLSEGTANLTSPTYQALAATVTATGLLTQGQVTFADWYSPGSSYLGAASQNFNLIGNPYASAIDLGTIQGASTSTGIYATTYNSGTNTGISKFVYELNPVTNIYGIYTDDGSLPATNSASQYIASGQGFFMQAFGANSSQLIFNESSKATTTNATVPGLMVTRHVLAAAVNTAGINPLLRLKMTLDSAHTEESLIEFNPNSKAQYVFNEDAPHKKGQGLLGFSSTSADNITMAVNSMPLLQSQTIPLNVYATNDGLYTISMEQVRLLPAIYEVWLMDAYKKDSLDIKNNPSYSFNVLNADTNSFGTKRFTLVIRESSVLGLHLLSFTAAKAPLGNQINWTTENEQNYTSFAVERSTDGGKTFNTLTGFVSSNLGTYSYLDKTPVIGANSYRLQLTDLNGTITYSNVVTIMYANTGNQIAINGMMLYPNPTSGTVNLAIDQSVTTQTAGSSAAITYTIQIINNLGSIIRTALSSSPNWQTDVSALVPGTYFIRVTNRNTNSVVGKSAFVKL